VSQADTHASARVMRALLQMKKIDLAVLRRAQSSSV